MNIRLWTALVNQMYSTQTFNDGPVSIVLSTILEYKWEPHLYEYLNIKNQSATFTPSNEYYTSPTVIKTVRIQNINKSLVYDIELVAPFTLLTFFGKPFSAAMDMDMDMGTTMSACNCGPSCSCGVNCNCGATCNCGPSCNCGTMDMGDNLQQISVVAGSVNGDSVSPINNNFSLLISANETYLGFCDGFTNDNFKNIAVQKSISEKWCYYNGSNKDWHPFHFHLTSGYAINMDQNYNFQNISINSLVNYLYYSNDVFNIPPQSNIVFRLKFLNYSSEEGTVPYLGYMYHCHFMQHHDMNMMSEYFVYIDKSDYFY